MIVIITYKDPKTGLIYVSHGIDTETDQHVTLPNEPIENFRRHGLEFNATLGEYTIP